MQKTETELGVSERVIKTTIALTKHEEAEARAARGYHADDEPITPGTVTATPSTMSIKYLDDGARDNFLVGVATGLGVPRGGVRITGTRAGSIILGTSATVDGDVKTTPAFASSFIDLAKSWDLRFGPYAVSGVRVEEPAAAVAPAEAAPVKAPAEPAPPPTPAMADHSPLRSIVVVLHDDDGNRYPEEEIEGRDVRVEEPAAAPTEAAPEEVLADPAPPPAPEMTDYIPLQTIGVVFYDNDDDRHLEEEIEGRDGGLRDHAVAEDDGELKEEEAIGRSHFLGLLHELADDEEEELNDDEEKTVRQDYCAAPWGSSGASGPAASATVGLGQLWRMIDGIDGGFHAERSVDTSVLTLREESPSLPTPDDASATGRTYDDIAKSPPPHLRCVVSATRSPVHRRVTTVFFCR